MLKRVVCGPWTQLFDGVKCHGSVPNEYVDAVQPVIERVLAGGPAAVSATVAQAWVDAAKIASEQISQYSGNEACAIFVSNAIIAAAPASEQAEPVQEAVAWRGWISNGDGTESYITCRVGEWLENSFVRGKEPLYAAPISAPRVGAERVRTGDVVCGTGRTVLACGSGIYSHAIVVSANPLVLVSEETDMLWSATTEEMTLKVIGQATKEVFSRCMARYVNSYTPRMKQQPDALTNLMDAVGGMKFDCHFDGDINACDKDCKQLGLCKRRTSGPLPQRSGNDG